jgi:hypothetical protein
MAIATVKSPDWTTRRMRMSFQQRSGHALEAINKENSFSGFCNKYRKVQRDY